LGNLVSLVVVVIPLSIDLDFRFNSSTTFSVPFPRGFSSSISTSGEVGVAVCGS